MPKVGAEGVPTSGGDGKFINRVRLLTDLEKCKIRFLTDYEDFFYERFHRNMINGEFKGYIICPSSALGQACELCSRGETTSSLFLGWVYEIEHDYTSNVEIKNATLTKVGSGKKTVWRQEVNEPRLLQASIMHFNPITFRYNMYDTLIDRDYSWIRVGERGSKRPSYMLEPESESELSSELQEIKNSLPDLEDVALRKVTSLGGDSEEVKEYGTTEVEAKDPFSDEDEF